MQRFWPRRDLDSYSMMELGAQRTAFLFCWATGLRLGLGWGYPVLRCPCLP